jgi:hypothetical protein
VTITAATDVTDVARALAVVWDAFCQASGDDQQGWDTAGASAKVWPERDSERKPALH